MNQRFEELTDKMNHQLEEQTYALKNHTSDSIKNLVQKLHDDSRVKIEAFMNSSTQSVVCGDYVTTHFVLYRDKMFGVSVAHVPCNVEDVPGYLHACPRLDVSIWSGVPPLHVHLLNITNRCAEPCLGDSATSFGFTGKRRQSWEGRLSGKMEDIESTENCRHFSSDHAWSHPKELSFSAACQSSGMSGGGAINGKGKFCH